MKKTIMQKLFQIYHHYQLHNGLVFFSQDLKRVHGAPKSTLILEYRFCLTPPFKMRIRLPSYHLTIHLKSNKPRKDVVT